MTAVMEMGDIVWEIVALIAQVNWNFFDMYYIAIELKYKNNEFVRSKIKLLYF